MTVIDNINPAHYRSHKSGLEVIVITERMNFCMGNATKYIARAGLKNDELEDLKKAGWYLDREINSSRKGSTDYIGYAAGKKYIDYENNFYIHDILNGIFEYSFNKKPRVPSPLPYAQEKLKEYIEMKFNV